MGRPKKPDRLYRYRHRENWYILSAGRPSTSTGFICLGKALASLRKFTRMRRIDSAPTAIESDPAMLSAVRKVIRKSRDRAKQKGMDFSLTEDGVLAMIERQGRRCAMSGLEFSISGPEAGRRLPFSPSADRIDNRLGYTMENIRVVCAIVNLARADFSDAEFLKMCRACSDMADRK